MAGDGSLLPADIVPMVEQAHSNVEAIQLCTAYYISHAYAEVRHTSSDSSGMIAAVWRPMILRV